ncbi:MAG: hypothetical protein LBP62_01140 [Clostridiales bacterium]|jgi:hypothetical protein|nr:hypothetical protein [Clostridiales bacterium]
MKIIEILMKNKKMTAIIAAAVLLLAAVGTTVGIILNNKNDKDTLSFTGEGIYNGYIRLFVGQPSLRLNLTANKNIDFDVAFSIEDETIAEIVKSGTAGKTVELRGIKAGYTKLFAKANKDNVKDVEMKIMVEDHNPKLEGAGTEEQPFKIKSKSDLFVLREKTKGLAWVDASEKTYMGQYFIVENNIVIEENEWAFNIERFDGILDGNGKQITIKGIVGDGLFGVLGHGSIINELKVSAILKQSSKWYTQGILASINNGSITACEVLGEILFNITENLENPLSNEFTVGGIVGENRFGVIINNISNVKISINYFLHENEAQSIIGMGGFCGLNHGQISNSIFLGLIVNNNTNIFYDYIGLFVGATSVPIQNLYYDKNINDNYNKIGYELIGDNAPPLEHINIGGVSDWSTVDFSGWDSEIWDFSGAYPRLAIFK